MHCPRCFHPYEDSDHIVRCTHQEATDIWATEINTIKTWFAQYIGSNSIIEAIITGLNAWRSNWSTNTSTSFPENINNALRQQSKIGWNNLLQGFFATEWLDCIQHQLHTIKSRKSAVVALSLLQKRLWKVAFKLWEHRNSFKHDTKMRLCNHDHTSLQDEIIKEWRTGKDLMHARFAYLLDGTIADIFCKSIHAKKQWLFTIWCARDTSIGPPRNRQGPIQEYLNWK